MKTKQIAQWRPKWRQAPFLALVLLGVAGCGNPILRDIWSTEPKPGAQGPLVDPVTDTTAPGLPSGRAIDQASAAGTTATIKFSADEGGTFYYIVLPEADSAPSPQTIQADGASGTAVVGINAILLEGLAAGAGYTVYIVVADAAGNLSAILDIPVSPRHTGANPAKDRSEQNEAALIAAGEITLTAPRAGGGSAQVGITLGEDGRITIVIDGVPREYPYTITGDTIIVAGGGSGGGDAELGFAIGDDGTLTLVGLDKLADGGLAPGAVVSDPNPLLIPPPASILGVAAPSFDGAVYGGERPGAKTITITNSGTADAAISSVALSGDGKDAFVLGGSGDAVSAGGSIATRTVQPAAGLAAGTYAATITVSYDGGAAATAALTVTVVPRPLTATATATDRVYNDTKTVTVTITPTNKVGSDDVTITATGTMADTAPGNDKDVAISNIALTGAAAGNYTAPGSIANTTVTIYPAGKPGITAWVANHAIVTDLPGNTAALSRAGAGGTAKTLPVTVTGGGSGDSYQWSIGGVVQEGETGASYTFDSAGRDTGIYRLTLRVVQGGVPYTTTISITVEE
ncbi:YDG domain-containing protein [Treponema primitia]|uniref:YDG domain-containing protein n=1 Tax=Treponema primitia TaxID=88058 RepID=UPI0002DF809E|nr:YDG domain-containing protein [Treponema primitia]